MALLLAANSYLRKEQLDHPKTMDGLFFWGAMYIPVIVAMSATQNVKAALSGGWAALLVGVLATAACFLLVPVLAKLGKDHPRTVD